jgi:hypothetical protein
MPGSSGLEVFEFADPDSLSKRKFCYGLFSNSN